MEKQRAMAGHIQIKWPVRAGIVKLARVIKVIT